MRRLFHLRQSPGTKRRQEKVGNRNQEKGLLTAELLENEQLVIESVDEVE